MMPRVDSFHVDLCRIAAETVLESMFFESLSDDATVQASSPGESICAEALFEGSKAGSLQIAAEPAVARRLTANFLGEDEGGVTPEQVDSTMCELANIYCGCLLSHLNPDGRLRIQSPRIVVHPAAGREWVQLPLEPGVLAVSLTER